MTVLGRCELGESLWLESVPVETPDRRVRVETADVDDDGRARRNKVAPDALGRRRALRRREVDRRGHAQRLESRIVRQRVLLRCILP